MMEMPIYYLPSRILCKVVYVQLKVYYPSLKNVNFCSVYTQIGISFDVNTLVVFILSIMANPI